MLFEVTLKGWEPRPGHCHLKKWITSPDRSTLDKWLAALHLSHSVQDVQQIDLDEPEATLDSGADVVLTGGLSYEHAENEDPREWLLASADARTHGGGE